MSSIQYSGDEIRALYSRYSIKRITRKCLFKNKIWKSQNHEAEDDNSKFIKERQLTTDKNMLNYSL